MTTVVPLTNTRSSAPATDDSDCAVPATADRVSELSRLITTEELAALLRVDPSTVRRWRTSHPVQGPPFIQLSERVTKYDMQDVLRWLARHRRDPEAA